MEKELRAAFSDISIELVPGHNGVFEVTLDARQIFTKSDVGRFPDPGEMTEIIKNVT